MPLRESQAESQAEGGPDTGQRAMHRCERAPRKSAARALGKASHARGRECRGSVRLVVAARCMLSHVDHEEEVHRQLEVAEGVEGGIGVGVGEDDGQREGGVHDEK